MPTKTKNYRFADRTAKAGKKGTSTPSSAKPQPIVEQADRWVLIDNGPGELILFAIRGDIKPVLRELGKIGTLVPRPERTRQDAKHETTYPLPTIPELRLRLETAQVRPIYKTQHSNFGMLEGEEDSFVPQTEKSRKVKTNKKGK